MEPIDHLSTVYLQIPITAAASPTSYPVRMALLPIDTPSLPDEPRPVDADWHAATLITVGSTSYAQLLVGPDGGAITLAAGLWRPWIDIDAGTEHPVVPAPYIEIT